MEYLKLFFKQTKETILDTFDFYKEHWLRYIFIILLFFCLSCLLLFITSDYRICKNFIYIQHIYENNILIEQKLYIYGLSLEIWLTFYTILSFIIGGLFALFQYDKSRKKKQQEKGSEISYKFSENIVKSLSIICFILQKNGFIKKHVLSLDPFSLKDFDYDELCQKIPNFQTIIEEYEKIISSEEINTEYINICKKILSIDEQNKMPPKFDILVGNTLNELESICMDISSTMAGSQFIYPSLHQIFLDTIHILYLHISITNNPEKVMVDKYYTNLIYVYNEWNKIRFRDTKKKEKVENKIKQINKQKEKQITKAKNKKPKRV